MDNLRALMQLSAHVCLDQVRLESAPAFGFGDWGLGCSGFPSRVVVGDLCAVLSD